MKVRSIIAVGFVSALAVIGMGNTSGGVAAEANQTGPMEERIGHGGSIIHSKTMSNCEAMVKGPLVEERIGHGGSILRSQTTGTCNAMAKGALVEERIGHGGSVYSRPSAHQTVN
jgi:hypothetical protein